MILSEFPEIGSLQYPEKNIRGFSLTKQISIFYKVEIEHIILLDLFDNRSDPIRKDEIKT